MHIAMETAVRPVADPCDISVLHRIEVDVIDVTLEVRVVAECEHGQPACVQAIAIRETDRVRKIAPATCRVVAPRRAILRTLHRLRRAVAPSRHIGSIRGNTAVPSLAKQRGHDADAFTQPVYY